MCNAPSRTDQEGIGRKALNKEKGGRRPGNLRKGERRTQMTQMNASQRQFWSILKEPKVVDERLGEALEASPVDGYQDRESKERGQ